MTKNFESSLSKAHDVFNPLHIYCRLVDCGMNPEQAYGLAQEYEATIFVKIKKMLDVYFKKGR
jgi:hypothetical protein